VPLLSDDAIRSPPLSHSQSAYDPKAYPGNLNFLCWACPLAEVGSVNFYVCFYEVFDFGELSVG